MKFLLAATIFYTVGYVQSYAQCTPAIPNNAIVVKSTYTNNGGFDPVWVCGGDTFISNGGIRDVFLEPGAVMTTGGGIDNIYVLAGAKLIMTGGIHDVYFVNFSDLTLSGGISTPISCPALAFNYANAPANGCAPSTPVGGIVTPDSPTCNTGCDGKATAVGNGGIPPYTYQWIGGPANPVYSGLCAGNYEVIITDSQNSSDTVGVTISDPPVIQQSISETACVSFQFNGKLLDSSGTYMDTLSSKDGCDSVITLNLVITPVNISVIKSGNDLTAQATGAGFKWLDCDNNYSVIIGSISSVLTGLPGKSYAVEVTENGCVDTSACYGINPVAISESDMGSDFQIFPNPSAGHFTINLPQNMVNHQIEILTISGTVLYQTEVQENVTTFDLSHVNSGVYFLKDVNTGRVKRFTIKH